MDGVTQIGDGETERQDALVLEIAALAREFALQFARRSQVDDVVQNVVLECLVLIRTGRWPVASSLPSLLNRIVRRRTYDQILRRRRATMREKQHSSAIRPADPSGMSPLLEMENAEVMAACEEALAHMRANPAAIYRAVRQEGWSTREVAKRLKLSVNSVSAHLRRADRGVRSELLALDLMPETTRASAGLLFAALGAVPAVRERRMRDSEQRQKADAAERERKLRAAIERARGPRPRDDEPSRVGQPHAAGVMGLTKSTT